MLTTQMFTAFLLAFASGTTMTLCFRYLASMSPFLTNAISGFVFATLCLVLWYFFGEKAESITIHPAVIILGIALAGLNVAYSLLYAAKAPTAYVPIIVTGVMTVLLGIAGRYLFGEVITMKFIAGAVLIIVGMFVMIS